MKTSKLTKLAESKADHIARDVNTNNAWGFGGALKDIYHFQNGFSLHYGWVFFRHLPKRKLTALRDQNNIILTEDPKKIEKIISTM